jgi:hypothetical protein
MHIERFIKPKGKIIYFQNKMIFSMIGYWRGVVPNMIRNSVINAAELATYNNLYIYIYIYI